MSTRDLILAIVAAVAVYVLSSYLYSRFAPKSEPQQPQAAATATTTGSQAGEPVATGSQPAELSADDRPVGTQPASAPGLTLVSAEEVVGLVLGGEADDPVEVSLTSQGAAVERIRLSAQRDGKYVYAESAENNAPYPLLAPLELPDGSTFASFQTPKLILDKQTYRLDDLNWRVVAHDRHRAEFAVELRGGAGGEAIARVRKVYELPAGSAAMKLTLTVENLTDDLHLVQLEQAGPVGIRREHTQFDMRRLIGARLENGRVTAEGYQRRDLKKVVDLGSSMNGFFWTALANRYFAVYTRPLGDEDTRPSKFVQKASGHVVYSEPPGPHEPCDYLSRILTITQKVEGGRSASFAFEIYSGTKNARDLEEANPAYADRKQIGYVAAGDADSRCCCTFPVITALMTWSLEALYAVLHNYGLAIIVLVIIIRALLHPLSVFQQKSMYRMQEAQARLAPKLNALKEKYANDRQRLNQETMKLYAEEGVNPMAGVIGMLPMLIQMPILISLWTALNTDVHLRHAAFDPWWITDLSAPDQFIRFDHPFTVPILGQLPLLGRMFSDIPSFNLLPVLMGVSMWLQQKYMPKPGMQAKLEAAKKAGGKHHHGGMSPEDQIRQQQMMSYMMSILFPIMFYYWPSGLNLYWFATNVFGIGESLLIRKQLEKERQRGELAGPAAPRAKRGDGPVARFFRRMAEKAEELQKKADELAKQQRPDDKTRKRK